jgi:4-hydroxy-tetrahydrodipicolinate synthase
MPSQDLANLAGYISALPTPFKHAQIDEAAFAKFCAWQIGQGVWGLVVNGTTGEAPTLTLDEQSRLVRIAVEAAQGRVPVIAGVGSNATAHVIELAHNAARAGADGLLVVTPYYNKPSQEGLYRHFRAVHDATALPLLLYDVPTRTGCALALDTVARLAELPRIVGLKDATGDLARPIALRRMLGERFRLLSGDDATALDYLGLGGDGCISVVSNAVPKLCNRLFFACFCGEPEEARAIERRLRPLVVALFIESNPVPLKWALSLMGHMSPELRLPLCEPAETTRVAVRKALTQLGLIGPQLLRSAARVLAFAG